MTTETQHPQNHRPERRALRVARAAHTFLHFLWSVLIFSCLVVIYLWVFGLPEGATNYLISKLQTEDFHVQARRARLDPFRGLLLDDIRLSGPPPLGENFTHASHLEIGLSRRRLLRGEIVVRSVSIVDGQLQWPYAFSGESFSTMNVTRVQASIALAPQQPTRVEVTGRAGVCQLNLAGDITESAGKSDFSPWAWMKVLVERSRDIPPGFAEFQRELRAARFSEPPLLNADFNVDAAHPENSEVRVAIDGSRTFFRGGVLDNWGLNGVYGNQKLDVAKLFMKSARGRLTAKGLFDYRQRTVSAHVSSDLSSGHAVRMLPAFISDWLRERGVRVQGALRADISIGPSPIEEAWSHARGSLAVEKMEIRDVWVERASASFSSDGDEFRVTDLVARVGQDQAQGPLAGDVALNRKTGERRANLSVEFDPNALKSLMTSAQIRTVELFSFPSAPPLITCEIERDAGSNGAWRAIGTMSARQYTFREVPIEKFSCAYTYENGRLLMRDWNLEREEGEITGLLALDFGRHMYEVDMASTADPNAVKKIIGPAFEKSIKIAHFSGPARVTARGVVDAQGGTNTDLNVVIEGERLGIAWFTAAQARFEVHALGRRYAFTDIDATGYGGSLSGEFTMYPDGQVPRTRYEINAVAKGMDVPLLLESARPGQTNQMTGTISGHVVLTGLIGEGQGKTAVGTGSVSIAKGELSKVRLLGGLSSLLNAISPGFGLASQTDFLSDFAIEKGRAVTKDAMLMGSIISIRAEGAYYFDQRLKFVVEVKPLRKGDLAALLRIFASPITKLFEFSVSGTLKEPKWRPSNLPKEMFLIFD